MSARKGIAICFLSCTFNLGLVAGNLWLGHTVYAAAAAVLAVVSAVVGGLWWRVSASAR